MGQIDNDANPPFDERDSLCAGWIVMSLVQTRLRSLARACEMGVAEEWDCRLSDIRCVESLWEVIDDDAVAHGFVVQMHDERRVYLEYCSHYEDGELIERVEKVAMGSEQFPTRKYGNPDWEDDLHELNQRLTH